MQGVRFGEAMTPRWFIPLMLGLLAGCGGTTRLVRLETGRGEPRVLTSRSVEAEGVELDADDFEEAVSELALDVRPPARPQEAARRLFEVGARSGSYLYEAHGQRLRPVGPGEHLTEALPEEEVELTRAYLRWCERTKRPGDCLRLLEEGPTVTGDGRYALAMALAQGAVLDELMHALEDMADPQAVLTAVLWTWTTYMVLLAVPEPFRGPSSCSPRRPWAIRPRAWGRGCPRSRGPCRPRHGLKRRWGSSWRSWGR